MGIFAFDSTFFKTAFIYQPHQFFSYDLPVVTEIKQQIKELFRKYFLMANSSCSTIFVVELSILSTVMNKPLHSAFFGHSITAKKQERNFITKYLV